MADNTPETDAGPETDSAQESESSGEAPQGGESEVKPYDFRKGTKMSKHQVAAMDRAHDQFARSVGVFLSGQLRRTINVELKSVEQAELDEFVQPEQEAPRCLLLLDIENLGANVVLEVGVDLALLIVDGMLGGKGELYGEPRELTVIEQRVTGHIVSGLLRHFDAAWRDVCEFETALQRIENKAELIPMGSRSEAIVAVSLDVQIDDSHYQFKIFYPGFTLGIIMRKAGENGQGPPGSEHTQGEISAAQARLQQTRVTLTAVLAETALTVHDFLNLQEGDLVSLDKNINDELLVKVGNRVKFKARPGVIGNRKAVQIVEPVSDEGGAGYE